MSAVLEPQAAEVEVIDRAEIKDGHALVAYSRTEAGLTALKADLSGKVYDLATVKGNKLARQDRQRCVSLRTALDKKRLEFKRPVLDIGKQIDTEAKRITDEILKLEAPIDAAIKADEERSEKIRMEKAAAEATRQQAHRDGIAKIRSYADAARLPGMTAEQLLKGLSALEGMLIDPAAWEEFTTEAAHVLGETIAAVKAEHSALVAKEAEAARLAQQAKEQAERQAELDRVAAEQAAQAAAIAAQQAAAAAALAAQQAEIERQRAELEAQQRAAAAAEAQRLQDEQDREDAHRRALWLEAQAALPAAPIPMQIAVIPAAESTEMMKHTPGPWHRNIRPARTYPVVFSGRNTHIAKLVDDSRVSDEEAEANISLIASAPELLQALLAAVRMIDDLNSAYGSDDVARVADAGRAAIAKAMPDN